MVSRSTVSQIRSTQVLACHCRRHNSDQKRAGTHAQTDPIAELERLGVSPVHLVLSCSRSNVRFNLVYVSDKFTGHTSAWQCMWSLHK